MAVRHPPVVAGHPDGVARPRGHRRVGLVANLVGVDAGRGGAGVAAFVLGIALEAWIVTHHPPVPETPAQVLSDVFGVDAALKDGARPFHREGFTRLTVWDGDGLAPATLFVRHITAPDGQRTVCVALFGADGLPVGPRVDRY